MEICEIYIMSNRYVKLYFYRLVTDKIYHVTNIGELTFYTINFRNRKLVLVTQGNISLREAFPGFISQTPDPKLIPFENIHYL